MSTIETVQTSHLTTFYWLLVIYDIWMLITISFTLNQSAILQSERYLHKWQGSRWNPRGNAIIGPVSSDLSFSTPSKEVTTILKWIQMDLGKRKSDSPNESCHEHTIYT